MNPSNFKGNLPVESIFNLDKTSFHSLPPKSLISDSETPKPNIINSRFNSGARNNLIIGGGIKSFNPPKSNDSIYTYDRADFYENQQIDAFEKLAMESPLPLMVRNTFESLEGYRHIDYQEIIKPKTNSIKLHKNDIADEVETIPESHNNLALKGIQKDLNKVNKTSKLGERFHNIDGKKKILPELNESSKHQNGLIKTIGSDKETKHLRDGISNNSKESNVLKKKENSSKKPKSLSINQEQDIYSKEFSNKLNKSESKDINVFNNKTKTKEESHKERIPSPKERQLNILKNKEKLSDRKYSIEAYSLSDEDIKLPTTSLDDDFQAAISNQSERSLNNADKPNEDRKNETENRYSNNQKEDSIQPSRLRTNNGTTRSGRVIVKPLRYWLNEKKEIGSDKKLRFHWGLNPDYPKKDKRDRESQIESRVEKPTVTKKVLNFKLNNPLNLNKKQKTENKRIIKDKYQSKSNKPKKISTQLTSKKNTDENTSFDYLKPLKDSLANSNNNSFEQESFSKVIPKKKSTILDKALRGDASHLFINPAENEVNSDDEKFSSIIPFNHYDLSD